MASKSAESKKLGRGLEVLFGENVGNVLEQIQKGDKNIVESVDQMILLKDIRPNPYQPRSVFDETKLQELSDSIKEHGVFTPVLVKKSIHGYDLIAGERRVRASKMANLQEIPAIIVEFNDDQMMEIALLENIQREDLSVIEESKGYQALIDKLGYTQEELAKRVGKSRVHITNTLRLLKLPTMIQDMVTSNELSMGHVRALLPLEKNDIIAIANKAANEGLSVRAVEKLVATILKREEKKEKVDDGTDYSYPQKLISDHFQTKVIVSNKQIVIKFDSDEDLNRILEVMHLIED